MFDSLLSQGVEVQTLAIVSYFRTVVSLEEMETLECAEKISKISGLAALRIDDPRVFCEVYFRQKGLERQQFDNG